jgi:membrane fusion protein (multidrug efflux system)
MIVPSNWLSWLKVGTPFDVVIDETSRTYPGKLVRISGKVDAISRSIKVYGRIDGAAPDLLPGMSGRALFKQPAAISTARIQPPAGKAANP